MNIFVAGATGAIGRRLVPALIERGHAVTGTTRSAESAALLERMGATPVVLDPLDAAAVNRAVRAAEPEGIVHELTALRAFKSFKRFDDEFAMTNRLRVEGLAHLLAAARAAGTRRIVVQSYTGWTNIREGGAAKTEEDPLDPNPPAAMRKTLAAIRSIEETVRQTRDLQAIALRYGSLYGPGTSLGADGELTAVVRKRQLPIVGNGAGVWSFLHIDDAAAATVAAIECEQTGIYNIVDDEPAPVSVWLPHLAECLGAKPPRCMPAWLARFMIGDAGVSAMTQIRGASNAKAKRELGWRPAFASWRDGFRHGRADSPRAAGQAKAA